MSTQSNGINMLDVKKRNRSSILTLVHQSNGISRKDIAANLGLTPAAITLITNDLINEQLLFETTPEQSNGRKGRKEVILEICRERFAVMGVYISKHRFYITCIDLNYQVLFEDTIYIDNCHQNSNAILSKIADIASSGLINYDVLRTHTLLGMGVCIHGIVNYNSGISITSYGIWEDHINVSSYLNEKLHIPILLTNNICALAHGESFLTNNAYPSDMLFIKYGPGVGASRIVSERYASVFDYNAIELGHLVMDPQGRPCICGNQGCLETIVGYNSIEQSLTELISPASTPKLYELTDGNPENINMEFVLTAYEAGDCVVVAAMSRAVHYLALAIKNAICLLSPKSVVLYGELFEHQSLQKALHEELSHYTQTQRVIFSDFNRELNALGPATTMIAYFYENGGYLE